MIAMLKTDSQPGFMQKLQLQYKKCARSPCMSVRGTYCAAAWLISLAVYLTGGGPISFELIELMREGPRLKYQPRYQPRGWSTDTHTHTQTEQNNCRCTKLCVCVWRILLRRHHTALPPPLGINVPRPPPPPTLEAISIPKCQFSKSGSGRIESP